MTPPTFILQTDLFLAEVMTGAPSSTLSVGTVVLTLLVGAVAFLVRALVNLQTEVEELKASLSARVRPAPTAAGMPTAEEMAAISAAVVCAFGTEAQIVAVLPAISTEQQSWSQEGRRQVFQSHKIR